MSGGQINRAVTFSLVIRGETHILQGVSNVSGAVILEQVVSCENDTTTNLGSNIVSPKHGVTHALLGEALGTFPPASSSSRQPSRLASRAGANACLAIGFSVLLLLLLPIDGCSINHTLLRTRRHLQSARLRELW